MIERVTGSGFQKAWAVVEPALSIKNRRDYSRATRVLDRLLDEIGDNRQHPLCDYIDILGTLIEEYEKQHLRIPQASPQSVLRELMDQHGLKQSDLPEVGSQGVVSEILSGKRSLNARQIKALCRRFSVSAEVFLA